MTYKIKIGFLKSIFLLLGITIFIQSSVAQNGTWDYVDGYIFTLKGDTIRGRIKLVSEQKACFTLLFIKDNNKPKRYSAIDVTGYYRNRELYESKRKPDGEYVFMRKVVSGKMSMYLYTFNTYNLTMGSILVNMDVVNKNVHVYLKRDSEMWPTLISGGSFRKKMCRYIADYPELALQVKNKELRYEDVVEIVQLYNKKFYK